MTTVAPALRVHVDGPDVVGSLTVFALIADAEPSVEYLSFAAAVERGASVTELADGAAVNELLVTNPLDVPFLLYAGQEILGAQQNRIIDDSVLVLARSQRRVAVSCVEHDRWDDDRHAEPFTPAPQAAYPSLRRVRGQGAVWAEVAAKSARFGVESETSAIHDVYEHHRHRLDDVAGAIAPRDGQVGTLAAIAGAFVVLDHVSRPDVWASLHGPIVQGYALDALGTEAPLAAPTPEDARAFVAALPRRVSALRHEGEFVALTAFAS